jgi:hypothetical protein
MATGVVLAMTAAALSIRHANGSRRGEHGRDPAKKEGVASAYFSVLAQRLLLHK